MAEGHRSGGGSDRHPGHGQAYAIRWTYTKTSVNYVGKSPSWLTGSKSIEASEMVRKFKVTREGVINGAQVDLPLRRRRVGPKLDKILSVERVRRAQVRVNEIEGTVGVRSRGPARSNAHRAHRARAADAVGWSRRTT